jgi:hypothetical protein
MKSSTYTVGTPWLSASVPTERHFRGCFRPQLGTFDQGRKRHAAQGPMPAVGPKNGQGSSSVISVEFIHCEREKSEQSELRSSALGELRASCERRAEEFHDSSSPSPPASPRGRRLGVTKIGRSGGVNLRRSPSRTRGLSPRLRVSGVIRGDSIFAAFGGPAPALRRSLGPDDGAYRHHLCALPSAWRRRFLATQRGTWGTFSEGCHLLICIQYLG